jgi:histidinol-phosphate/aromatic aminotransferase/cobyric acid decarboxylase-like protein
MSKAFGLAGLRVGYGVGPASLVGFVERARGPYKVSVAAERTAFAALEDSERGLGWMRAHARLARENREQLVRALRSIDLQPLPSQANFVLVPHPRASDAARRMRDEGVVVRCMTGLPETLQALCESGGSALRIGVGPWNVMERVLAALGRALA